MVKIRLRRIGTRNKPIYRMVVADERSPRDGKFIEIIGHYNPLTEPETFDVDEEKALKWLKYGAQPTGTALRLLTKVGVIDKFRPVAEKKVRATKPKKAKTKAGTKAKSTTEESS
ncbi:MAG: 30S ribosomal protein S16 [Dehalococcoidia bacterium]|nr:30S ribosomal protein S16 [Dehalococcoidia bacterium]